MGNPKNVIEMNGKRYDASTGKIVGESSASHSPQKAGENVDGFVKRKVAKPAHHPTQPKANSVHHKPEHAKTLMRSSVKKPKPQHPNASINGRLTPLTVSPEPIVAPIDQKRFARAKKISKSRLITRFNPKSQTSDLVNTPSLGTRPPAAEPKTAKDDNKTRLQKSLNQAVANSRSHEQPHYKAPKKRRALAVRLNISQRALNASLFTLAFVLIGGFVAYQNVPNLSMRLAAARSGVHGSLPGYKPSGFNLSGPIFYQPGQITLAYKSNSDDRKFNVVQRNSAWNNEALLEKYVTTAHRSYQTYQENGKTIYIYDGSNASWIDKGVWYEVQGSTSLSKDQLIKLANSL